MGASFAEKAQVAAITATLVSAGWIVAGAFLLDKQEAVAIDEQIEQSALPATAESEAAEETSEPQETVQISRPDEAEKAQLRIPVQGISAADLTDSFVDERGGGTRLHEAIDIMAPTGTSVIAAAPGTIERLFQSDAGGNTIYVRSEDRETIYYYAHLDAYAEGLNEGQTIRRGQRLGTVGSSGNASKDAPHLHFAVMRTTPDAEWWEPTTALNPYPMLVKRAN